MGPDELRSSRWVVWRADHRFPVRLYTAAAVYTFPALTKKRNSENEALGTPRKLELGKRKRIDLAQNELVRKTKPTAKVPLNSVAV